MQGATGCSVQAARGTVRLAERLDGDLRPLGDLLVAGQVSRRHCTAVVHGVRGLGAEVIATALEAICTLALHADPERLASELRTRAEAISPELAEQARRRLDARVGVSCDETPDGTGHLSGTLHPETLALFQAVTDAVVHGERLEGDTRSQVRRRHDALQKVLQHAADCAGLDLPAQGGTRAQISIVATAATVAGLAGAEPARLLGTRQGLLTRSELLRLLCDADVSTVHLSADLERLDLSRLTRTVIKGQWRALTARDRECVVRGCHRRPSQCQARHVLHWACGGPSDLEKHNHEPCCRPPYGQPAVQEAVGQLGFVLAAVYARISSDPHDTSLGVASHTGAPPTAGAGSRSTTTRAAGWARRMCCTPSRPR